MNWQCFGSDEKEARVSYKPPTTANCLAWCPGGKHQSNGLAQLPLLGFAPGDISRQFQCTIAKHAGVQASLCICTIISRDNMKRAAVIIHKTQPAAFSETIQYFPMNALNPYIVSSIDSGSSHSKARGERHQQQYRVPLFELAPEILWSACAARMQGYSVTPRKVRPRRNEDVFQHFTGSAEGIGENLLQRPRVEYSCVTLRHCNTVARRSCMHIELDHVLPI
jgi:hypothetical protein